MKSFEKEQMQWAARSIEKHTAPCPMKYDHPPHGWWEVGAPSKPNYMASAKIAGEWRHFYKCSGVERSTWGWR